MGVVVYDALGEIANAWEVLASKTDAPPWLRPGWVGPWWDAFGRGKLEIVTVWRGSELVAVLPLQRRWGELRSTANYHSPESGVVADGADAAEELLRALFERAERRISLHFVTTPIAAMQMRAARHASRPYRCITRLLERSPYVPIELGWEEYQKRLPGSLLREMRRRRRLLQARGVLELSVEDGADRIDEHLDEGFAVEAAGWKGRRRTAIDSSAVTRGFYRAIAGWAAHHGWLRLAFLRLGERAIAFDYALEFGGRHYLLKTGFDPALRAFAPGILLRYEMLSRAFADSMASYEFLGRDEPWKLVWANRTRERMLVQAFAPSPAGLFDWTAFAIGRPVAKRVLAFARR